MPELAEVELARRTWLPALEKKIITVETHPRTRIYRDTPAAEIEAALTNSTLTHTRSHGKRLLFTFTKNTQELPLEVHLGMAGRLSIHPPDHQPHKHDHLILHTSELTLAFNDYRQFGRAHLHSDNDPWSSLPPEVFSRRFTEKYLTQVLTKRSRTNLKALILDQNYFPGIGNWMADEICWRLHLHPATPTANLVASALRKETQWVTRGALKHVADKNESLLNKPDQGFTPGSYVQQVPPRSWLFQHRWKPGGSCPRCQTELSRATIATRTTAWCPACQPKIA
ncbi:MAG: DNA-formamidopyrimidine glycosylase family protein [Verrucomicrobiota bacterium]